MHVQQTKYTAVYAKVQTNRDTHDKVMCDVKVKQRWSFTPTLFGLYIDEFATYLDEMDKDSLRLFDIGVAILLYVDDVDLLPQSRLGLQRHQSQGTYIRELSQFGPCLGETFLGLISFCHHQTSWSWS